MAKESFCFLILWNYLFNFKVFFIIIVYCFHYLSRTKSQLGLDTQILQKQNAHLVTPIVTFRTTSFNITLNTTFGIKSNLSFGTDVIE